MSAREKTVRRQILVLTPEETRALCFVLMMLVFGLATKHYRDHFAPATVEKAKPAKRAGLKPARSIPPPAED